MWPQAGLARMLSQLLPLLLKEGDLIPALPLTMASSLRTMNGVRKLIWAKNTQFCLFNFNLGHFPNPVSPEATEMPVSARRRGWQRSNLCFQWGC